MVSVKKKEIPQVRSKAPVLGLFLIPLPEFGAGACAARAQRKAGKRLQPVAGKKIFSAKPFPVPE